MLEQEEKRTIPEHLTISTVVQVFETGGNFSYLSIGLEAITTKYSEANGLFWGQSHTSWICKLILTVDFKLKDQSRWTQFN